MTVYFRPCGDLALAPLPRSRADELFLERLSAATGVKIETSDEVDYEDWMEPASMLDAALRAGVEIAVLPRERLPDAIAAPEVLIPGAPCPDMLIGRQISTDPAFFSQARLSWPPRCNDLANRYTMLEAFRNNAGRELRVAMMPGDPNFAGKPRPVFGKEPGDLSLGEALLAFAGRDCLVKQVYPAKILPLLTITPEADMDEKAAEQLFIDEVGFHFMRFEGDRDALLVQEIVTMTHETRFFVVNGEVVTGAACIEADTPRQHPEVATVLADRFEILRNSGTIVTSPEAAEKLLGFARKVAAEIAAETPDIPHFVLDACLGKDGEPLVIEMNPIAESGLYGIDAGRLFTAILEAARREPARKPAAVPVDTAAEDEETLDLASFDI
ncbi:ATP-grasp domain-containing protein [Cereibacter sphaeroides]|uniref:ATP-grasp domain-containing protein n=1 Tax=Cereibacter sphaeroides TaxID=1063 RepID=UPI001F317C20|nr:ATP-grasp domain-containing protein [Cereibacter sphaeroides]MCE6958749.1 ATP-grasp domain-containing protein [Cereibacter sphaeroides]MCE6973377.1 ATP-grasp domain-containing protein [Cereibacter sphaeroides]